MESALSRKIAHISFLLLILVVFIHGYNENIRFADQPLYTPSYWLQFFERFISDGICRVAVPLFFAISGFLGAESAAKEVSLRTFVSILYKRIFSLLIPFLLVSLCGILLVIILQKIPFSAPFFNNFNLETTSIRDWMRILLISPVPYQLWFIRFLMDYFLVFPLLFFAVRYLREPLILGLFLAWALSPLKNDYGYFRMVFTTITSFFFLLSDNQFLSAGPLSKIEFEGFFFFSLGVYISIHGKSLVLKKPNSNFLVVLFFCWITWIFYRTILNIFYPDMHFEIHFHQIGFTFTGVILVWFLYDLFTKSSRFLTSLDRYSRYSFGIFLFHEPFLTILKKGIIGLLGINDFTLLLTFIFVPIMAFIFSLWFSNLLSIQMPGIYKIFTGNRGRRSTSNIV